VLSSLSMSGSWPEGVTAASGARTALAGQPSPDGTCGMNELPARRRAREASAVASRGADARLTDRTDKATGSSPVLIVLLEPDCLRSSS
jgi:hypothetical protein